MAKEYQKAERDADQAFFSEIRSLNADLTDKGMFGMRGSSKEHQALVDAFENLNNRNVQITNADENNLALFEKNKKKAMEEARAAVRRTAAERTTVIVLDAGHGEAI